MRKNRKEEGISPVVGLITLVAVVIILLALLISGASAAIDALFGGDEPEYKQNAEEFFENTSSLDPSQFNGSYEMIFESPKGNTLRTYTESQKTYILLETSQRDLYWSVDSRIGSLYNVDTWINPELLSYVSSYNQYSGNVSMNIDQVGLMRYEINKSGNKTYVTGLSGAAYYNVNRSVTEPDWVNDSRDITTNRAYVSDNSGLLIEEDKPEEEYTITFSYEEVLEQGVVPPDILIHYNCKQVGFYSGLVEKAQEEEEKRYSPGPANFFYYDVPMQEECMSTKFAGLGKNGELYSLKSTKRE